MDTTSVSAAAVRPTTSVADARESTREFLEGLVPAVAVEPAETVVLVVSELVTNALRHGGGTCALDLTAHPDSIEVAVHDRSPQAPRMRTPDLNGGTGGFGWPMVNHLAHATAVTRQAAGGKTVSALLHRSHQDAGPGMTGPLRVRTGAGVCPSAEPDSTHAGCRDPGGSTTWVRSRSTPSPWPRADRPAAPTSRRGTPEAGGANTRGPVRRRTKAACCWVGVWRHGSPQQEQRDGHWPG